MLTGMKFSITGTPNSYVLTTFLMFYFWFVFAEFSTSSGDVYSNLTHCSVCFEEYDLYKHTPRILPCFHTLCQECISHLLKQPNAAVDHLLCPHCRKKHVIQGKGFTFQENEYIISFIKGSAKQIKNSDFSRCKIHNRELTHYCKTESCKKTICCKGWKEEHNEHDVIDVEEEKEKRKDILKQVVNDVRSALTKNQEMASSVISHHKKIMNEIDAIRIKSKAVIDRILDSCSKDSQNLKEDNIKAIQNNRGQLITKENNLKDIFKDFEKPGHLPDLEFLRTLQEDTRELRTVANDFEDSIYKYDDAKINMEIETVLGHDEVKFKWSSHPESTMLKIQKKI